MADVRALLEGEAMKRFLVVGTDGQIEQTFELAAEDVTALIATILESIRALQYFDWEPRSYVIYEIVGRVGEIDAESVEAAIIDRDARLREEHKKRRDTEERQDYERLRKKFEGA